MKKLLISLLLTALTASFLTGCKSSDYKKAMELQESGNYSEALELYQSISNYDSYKDTAERINDCQIMLDAIASYDHAKNHAEQENAKLDTAIETAEALISENKPALDDTLIPELETAVSEAKSAKQSINEMPDTSEKILAEADILNKIDYTDTISIVSSTTTALDKSIRQYDLVNVPSEKYVIKCLKKVKTIDGISAVTEDHDPNGNLNKAGGYISQVYFSSPLLNQSEIYGNTLIDKGTDAGGSIEVYPSSEDAIKRNEYLASFDGTILASGSHTVIGTVVVRTSDELTATQQNELESKVISKLTKLPN